jgi:hypothetical protein
MKKMCSKLLLFLVLLSCKEKKQKTIASEDLTAVELIVLIPDMKLPLLMSDTVLIKNDNDSFAVSHKVVQRMLSDSIFLKFYPRPKLMKLFALGKATNNDGSSYVLLKSVSGSKREAHLFHFNKAMLYTDGLKLAGNEVSAKGKKYGRIDNKLNIALCEDVRTVTGELYTNETVYGVNDSGKYMIVMTNSNEDLSDEILGNPIDTFARKQLYSADYVQDKKNMVSVRDGLTAKTITFFIHVSKQNGACVGELKGEATFTEKNKAVYKDEGSDCEINFIFSKSAVTIKEINACGSYRDITCFFEGAFAKKVVPKPAAKPVKKK